MSNDKQEVSKSIEIEFVDSGAFNADYAEYVEQLQKEVERLREALITVNRILHDDCFAVAMPAKEYIELALSTYQPQSLRHIESRVEEETIERCAFHVDVEYSEGEWLKEMMPRKYKEQSDD